MLLDKDRLGIPYLSGWTEQAPWMQKLLLNGDSVTDLLFEVRAAIRSNRLDTNLLESPPCSETCRSVAAGAPGAWGAVPRPPARVGRFPHRLGQLQAQSRVPAQRNVVDLSWYTIMERCCERFDFFEVRRPPRFSPHPPLCVTHPCMPCASPDTRQFDEKPRMRVGFLNGLRDMLGEEYLDDVRAAVMHFIGAVSQELIKPINVAWKTAVQGGLIELANSEETYGDPALLCAMAKVTLIKLSVAGPLAAAVAVTATKAAEAKEAEAVKVAAAGAAKEEAARFTATGSAKTSAEAKLAAATAGAATATAAATAATATATAAEDALAEITTATLTGNTWAAAVEKAGNETVTVAKQGAATKPTMPTEKATLRYVRRAGPLSGTYRKSIDTFQGKPIWDQLSAAADLEAEDDLEAEESAAVTVAKDSEAEDSVPWVSNVPCGPYNSGERAQHLIETEGKSMEDARLQVMNDYPAAFGLNAGYFIFWGNVATDATANDGRWCISRSQYREDFLIGKDTSNRGLRSAAATGEAPEHWWKADWSPIGATASALDVASVGDNWFPEDPIYLSEEPSKLQKLFSSFGTEAEAAEMERWKISGAQGVLSGLPRQKVGTLSFTFTNNRHLPRDTSAAAEAAATAAAEIERVKATRTAVAKAKLVSQVAQEAAEDVKAADDAEAKQEKAAKDAFKKAAAAATGEDLKRLEAEEEARKEDQETARMKKAADDKAARLKAAADADKAADAAEEQAEARANKAAADARATVKEQERINEEAAEETARAIKTTEEAARVKKEAEADRAEALRAMKAREKQAREKELADQARAKKEILAAEGERKQRLEEEEAERKKEEEAKTKQKKLEEVEKQLEVAAKVQKDAEEQERLAQEETEKRDLIRQQEARIRQQEESVRQQKEKPLHITSVGRPDMKYICYRSRDDRVGLDDASSLEFSLWQFTKWSGEFENVYSITHTKGDEKGDKFLSCGGQGGRIYLAEKDNGEGHQRWRLIVAGNDVHGTFYNIRACVGSKRMLSCRRAGAWNVDLFDKDNENGRQRWRIPNLVL